jgi:hypothetical protein
MKRFFLLMAAVWTAAVYAEDAATLPAKTLRLDAGTAIGFVREGWDEGGRKADAPDAMIIGARIGLSYGFTDWFTAVLDWSPGVTDTDLTAIDIGDDGTGDAEIYEGLGDFSLKWQFQIVGDKAGSGNKEDGGDKNNARLSGGRFRMRVTPGIVIPFPGIGDRDALGNHTWGLGGDVSIDTFITDSFFLNMFSEVYLFPVDNKSGTNNKWEFSLEAGPHCTVTTGTASLVFSLPVHWSGADVSSHLLTLRPKLALKLTRPFAINIEIEYACPLYGKNSYAVHTITIKAPVNFNFAKNKGRE